MKFIMRYVLFYAGCLVKHYRKYLGSDFLSYYNMHHVKNTIKISINANAHINGNYL